jgi:hypothetical protein
MQLQAAAQCAYARVSVREGRGGGLYASREYLCALVLSKVEALARQLDAREGCRTGRRRAAAGRGCRYMHGRSKHAVGFCAYVCLGVCGGWMGGWGGWDTGWGTVCGGWL